MKKNLSWETHGFLQRYERQIVWIMKRSLFMFCILFLNFTAFAFSQKVTINLGSVTLHEALKEIGKKTNVDFFYSEEELDANRKVYVSFKDEDLSNVVSTLIGENFKLEKQGEGLYLIIPKEVSDFQDQFIVNGVVTDENNQPMPGVTIMVKGTRVGTSTDFDGKFRIRVAEENTLTLSFVGYLKQEIVIKDDKDLKIQLKPDVAELDAVVVTGIVERKKETFTGTVNTITGDEIREIGNLNIIESVKTLDPSFIVLENNLQGSNPNILPTIEVRGKTSVSTDDLRDSYGADPNSPLFVLDGFETSLRRIMDLDMNRVASITILKDAASTALYGSKAANGVVVVETKRPKEGKLQVNYIGDYNIQFPDLSDYNLMNAEEKLEFERLSGRWTSSLPELENQIRMDTLYAEKLAEVRRGVNTYWLSEPTQTAISQKHSVYVSGGTDEIRFNTGVSYRAAEGVMKGSGRDTWNANVDLTYRKGKWNVSNRLYLGGYDARESNYGSFRNFAEANPYYRKYDEFGEITRYFESVRVKDFYGFNVVNPLYYSTLNSKDETNNFNITNNFGINYDISSVLRFQGQLQINKVMVDQEVFVDPEDPIFDDVNFFERGEYRRSQVNSFGYRANAGVVYHDLWGEKHMINGNVRFDIEEQNNEAYNTTTVGFPAGSNGNPGFAFSYKPDSKPGYNITKYRRNNILGSVNYAYDNRFLLDATYRIDGSTAFGSNEKYSPFWSVGAGWNLHNEMKVKSDVLNLFRVRQTLGYTGNQNLGSIASTSIYTYLNRVNGFGTGLGLTTLANPDLEWQRTYDTNLGIDLAMFKNRFDAQFNIYTKKSEPLVVPVDLASSTGLVSYPLNVGRLDVNGLEVIAGYKVINDLENRITWRLRATAAMVNMEYGGFDNTLRSLNDQAVADGEESFLEDKPLNEESLRRYRDGYSPDDIWAVPSLGIDPASGREVFLKKNGQTTYEYDNDDAVVVGTSRPDVEGVISSYFNIKDFSFNLNVRYRFGGQNFNNALYQKVENISVRDITLNQDRRALYDRWQQPGDISQFKAIGLTGYTPISSRFVQDENVLIGESINVGYRASNKKWLSAIGIRTLRLNAYMNDIFRISSIQAERGIDYPFARSVSFSINAMF
ncbi:SusC/RagA family TonB-linked outer membrane protein [Zhouia amylolytica]|nr:SusC/RagA family TonB-linked outer membrane protein [Zhouia amylolytica]